MAVDNIALPKIIDRSKGSDDAHLLIGKAMGEIYRRENRTESYVCCPPAFSIVDSDGAVFTLGFEYIEYPRHYEFNVLRNDVSTGQFAEKIEYRNGVVRIFGRDGTRTFSRNKCHFI